MNEIVTYTADTVECEWLSTETLILLLEDRIARIKWLNERIDTPLNYAEVFRYMDYKDETIADADEILAELKSR